MTNPVCITDDVNALRARIAALESLYASRGNPPLKGDKGDKGDKGNAGLITGATSQQLIRTEFEDVPRTFAYQYFRTLPAMPTGAIDFRGQNNSVAWNDTIKTTIFGDTVGKKYYCESWRFGFNNDLAGNPINPLQPSTYLYLEHMFTQNPETGAGYGSEFHVVTHRTVSAPTRDHRALDFFLPHTGDDKTADAHAVIRMNQIYFADWSDQLKLEWNFKDNVDFLRHYKAFEYLFQANDKVIGRQQSSTPAKGLLPLPYINNRDELIQEQPGYSVTTPVANVFGVLTAQTFFVPVPSANGVNLIHGYLGTNVSATGLLIDSDSSGLFQACNLRNNAASGRLKAGFKTVTGDCFATFANDSVAYSIGLDASNSRFEIAKSANGFSSSVLVRFGSDRVEFESPIKYPVLTVAQILAIPSPTAGMTLVCSNCRVSGQTAGNGTGSLVNFVSGQWYVAGTNQIIIA